MKQKSMPEKDEHIAMYRIIADCVQAQFPYVSDPAEVVVSQ
jgi:hypothetical protein